MISPRTSCKSEEGTLPTILVSDWREDSERKTGQGTSTAGNKKGKRTRLPLSAGLTSKKRMDEGGCGGEAGIRVQTGSTRSGVGDQEKKRGGHRTWSKDVPQETWPHTGNATQGGGGGPRKNQRRHIKQPGIRKQGQVQPRGGDIAGKTDPSQSASTPLQGKVKNRISSA